MVYKMKTKKTTEQLVQKLIEKMYGVISDNESKLMPLQQQVNVLENKIAEQRQTALELSNILNSLNETPKKNVKMGRPKKIVVSKVKIKKIKPRVLSPKAKKETADRMREVIAIMKQGHTRTEAWAIWKQNKNKPVILDGAPASSADELINTY